MTSTISPSRVGVPTVSDSTTIRSPTLPAIAPPRLFPFVTEVLLPEGQDDHPSTPVPSRKSEHRIGSWHVPQGGEYAPFNDPGDLLGPARDRPGVGGRHDGQPGRQLLRPRQRASCRPGEHVSWEWPKKLKLQKDRQDKKIFYF